MEKCIFPKQRMGCVHFPNSEQGSAYPELEDGKVHISQKENKEVHISKLENGEVHISQLENGEVHVSQTEKCTFQVILLSLFKSVLILFVNNLLFKNFTLSEACCKDLVLLH